MYFVCTFSLQTKTAVSKYSAYVLCLVNYATAVENDRNYVDCINQRIIYLRNIKRKYVFSHQDIKS